MDIYENDWIENKKFILSRLDELAEEVGRLKKDNQNLRLYLQKIEINTEQIKSCLSSNEKTKETSIGILMPILTTLLGAITSYVLLKIK